MNKSLIRAAVAASILTLGACATPPPTNAALEDARAAVGAAEADPNVPKYAPTELDRARKLLVNAQGNAEERGAKDPRTAHYAYLATQMAHIAEQRAHAQVATARIKSGESERQKILLAAREGEADKATAEARAAQSDALAAKTAAEQARSEAQNAQAELAAAQAESQRLASELQNVKTAQTSRGLVLTLDDVLFATGRSDLKTGSRRTLDQIAQFLTEHPDRSVQIEGFTDSQGGDNYNLELAQSRADAVAQAIIQRGVDAQRVRALGYGEGFPVASNSSEGSRQLNRRVEIIVANDKEPIPARAAGSVSPP
jgi:outer membrane protein OmpA-like peptidoglycan-associated protein